MIRTSGRRVVQVPRPAVPIHGRSGRNRQALKAWRFWAAMLLSPGKSGRCFQCGYSGIEPGADVPDLVDADRVRHVGPAAESLRMPQPSRLQTAPLKEGEGLPAELDRDHVIVGAVCLATKSGMWRLAADRSSVISLASGMAVDKAMTPASGSGWVSADR